MNKFVEENVCLIGINRVLEAKIAELGDRVVKAESSEVEALLLVKAIEEKALKVVDDFRMSDEFSEEKASFVLDAYDEEKHVVHEEIASKYSELDLSFLDIPLDNLSSIFVLFSSLGVFVKRLFMNKISPFCSP